MEPTNRVKQKQAIKYLIWDFIGKVINLQTIIAMKTLTLITSLLVFQACLNLEETNTVVEWELDGGYSRLYGMHVEDFIKKHQKSLIVVYDSSAFSAKIMEEIQKVHEILSEEGLKLNLAKLFHGDTDRHVITWNIKKFPFLRLYFGEEVYIDLNMYPSSTNIYNELTRILNSDDNIIEINSQDKVDQFNKEPKAFYLRFPFEQTENIYFLEKVRQLDSSIPVYYTNQPEFDVFKSFDPNQVVIGMKMSQTESKKMITTPEKLDRPTVLSFYHAYKNPDFKFLDEDTLFMITSKKMRTFVYFDEAGLTERQISFQRAAFAFKSTLLFIVPKLDNSAYTEIKRMCKVSTRKKDQMRILDFTEDDVVVYDISTKDYESILEGIKSFNAGILEPYQPNPEQPEEEEEPEPEEIEETIEENENKTRTDNIQKSEPKIEADL